MSETLTTEQVEEMLALAEKVVGASDAVSHRDFLRMIKDGRAVASLATELLALRKRVEELEEREVKNGRITAVWDEDMGQFRPLPTPKEPS